MQGAGIRAHELYVSVQLNVLDRRLYLRGCPERDKLVPPPDHGSAGLPPANARALGAYTQPALNSRHCHALWLVPVMARHAPRRDQTLQPAQGAAVDGQS